MAIIYSYIYIIGILLVFSFGFKPQDRIFALKLSFLGLFIYSVYTVLAYLGCKESGYFLLYSDQDGFYKISCELGQSDSIIQLFRACFIDRVHVENEGIYFLMGLIAYVANVYFDGNSVLLQMLHVNFIASLIPLMVFLLLRFYFSSKVSFYYALGYLFCSYTFAYSAWLLRDIHVALFSLVLLILIHKRFSLWVMLWQFIVVFLLLEFRLESGIISFPLILLYIFITRKDISGYSKLLLGVVRILAIIVCTLAFTFIATKLMNIMFYMDNYVKYTANALEQDSTGLGKIIYQLPWGIKHIFIVLYSQISPFPCWNILLQSKNIYEFIVGCVYMISPIFWFYINYVIIRILFSSHKIHVPLVLNLLCLFYVIFLFLNTSNMNIRRIFCFYPILYLYYVCCVQQIPILKKIKFQHEAISCYIILCLCYILVKYMI